MPTPDIIFFGVGRNRSLKIPVIAINGNRIYRGVLDSRTCAGIGTEGLPNGLGSAHSFWILCYITYYPLDLSVLLADLRPAAPLEVTTEGNGLSEEIKGTRPVGGLWGREGGSYFLNDRTPTKISQVQAKQKNGRVKSFKIIYAQM